MTCIVGLVHNDKVYIGGDSAGVAGHNIMARKDPKVFIRHDMIFGFTTSFRMGQILQHYFKPPTPPNKGSCYSYMCTTFMDALMECFTSKKFITKQDGSVSGGTFLVGLKGQLFKVDSDFQIEMHYEPYNACGSGQEYAFGALHATNKYDIDPITKLTLALDAASCFCTGVCKPYIISHI